MQQKPTNPSIARTRARVAAHPVAGDVRNKLESLTVRALEVLGDVLETGETREQAECARVLLSAWSKLSADERAATAAATGATPEERAERMRALLAAPPPELRQMLAEAGWTRPVPS